MKRYPVFYSLILLLVIVIAIGVILISEPPERNLPLISPEPKSEVIWDVWISLEPNGGTVSNTTGTTGRKIHLYTDNTWHWLENPEYYGISREGYGFKNWNTKADGTGKIFNPDEPIYITDIDTFELYAIWEENS